MAGDELDEYREEYNDMLLKNVTGANSFIQEKYVTISINKKNVEEARNYFKRAGNDLISGFARLGASCVELGMQERLKILFDFYRKGEEEYFHFELKDHMRQRT